MMSLKFQIFLTLYKECNSLIRIEIILPKNDVMAISEGLKIIQVGGLLVSKIRGRDKFPRPEIHSSKGSKIFTPQFGHKYVLEVIVPDSKEKDVIRIVRENSKFGKIFTQPVLHAIDIGTGNEGEEVI